MPFKSEKQRRWMHANKPEMAKRWEAESKLKKKSRKRKTATRSRGLPTRDSVRKG